MKNNTWNSYDEAAMKELNNISDSYIDFLSENKTERECVSFSVKEAEKKGYKNIEELDSVNPGDKVYAVCMNKAIALFNIGQEPLVDGMNILGAHIDSPRMDIKQNPLYEKDGLAYLDTHYYGGIKKYQWVTLPLAIHGVFVKKNGEVVNVNIGEDENDPVFCVSDLLIHLASKQMDKKGSVVVEGENLDILFGSIPLKDEEKDAVKKQVLNILKEKYDVKDDDFISAELEVVPAGKARSLGLDKSMVLAYGHDDKVCAYASLLAMLEVDNPKRTSCCLLVDKEEIGSVGATGMRSHFFENTVAELMNLCGVYSELNLRRCLRKCKMLSSDVSAGFDPLYADVFSKQSTCYLGNGVVFNKFTGARGKSGSNDANAEYLAYIRKVLDDNNVSFQMAELGKVDAGGGGTIAYIMSLYGMEVIDCGVAVLSMHAPYEVISKADLYEAYKAYKAFISVE